LIVVFDVNRAARGFSHCLSFFITEALLLLRLDPPLLSQVLVFHEGYVAPVAVAVVVVAVAAANASVASEAVDVEEVVVVSMVLFGIVEASAAAPAAEMAAAAIAVGGVCQNWEWAVSMVVAVVPNSPQSPLLVPAAPIAHSDQPAPLVSLPLLFCFGPSCPWLSRLWLGGPTIGTIVMVGTILAVVVAPPPPPSPTRMMATLTKTMTKMRNRYRLLALVVVTEKELFRHYYHHYRRFGGRVFVVIIQGLMPEFRS